MHALGCLTEGSAAALEELEIGIYGVGGDGVECVGGEVGGAVELELHLSVVLEVVAYGETDPICLIRECDT